MRAWKRSDPAWPGHYKKYEREQSPEDRVAYARAEKQARAERHGLWRDPKPMPPWEFRKHWASHDARLSLVCVKYVITQIRVLNPLFS